MKKINRKKTMAKFINGKLSKKDQFILGGIFQATDDIKNIKRVLFLLELAILAFVISFIIYTRL